MITRRAAIKNTLLAGAAFSFLNSSEESTAQTSTAIPEAVDGPFILPPLGYAYDALEPYIDAKTMEIHHDKHHAAYVKNLNLAVAKLPGEQQKWSVEDLITRLSQIPETERTAIQNNGGGHFNHSLFWATLKKDGGRAAGLLGDAIKAKFGSYEDFEKQITATAMKVFGSGWAWLSLSPEKMLLLESTPNQNSPIAGGNQPLLGIDVWEHAYYLKYQNKRADYVAALLKCINWDVVSGRFAKFTA
ncbi:MAG TPA: superoxide dismutase [Chthoniobacterales bacterium]